MIRAAFLTFALSAPLAAFGAASAKPNIIFILADDHGYGDIGNNTASNPTRRS